MLYNINKQIKIIVIQWPYGLNSYSNVHVDSSKSMLPTKMPKVLSVVEDDICSCLL